MAEPAIAQSLAAVMADIDAVAKTGRNTAQNFNFRGVDAVVNTVGPVLRKHHVICLPDVQSATYEQVEVGAKRSLMEHCTLIVGYQFVGPAGDSLRCVVVGEAMDSGDKAASKAMSVAYRTALLQALCIPTDEPDPDASSYERSSVVLRIAEADAARLAEVLNRGGKDARKAWMERFGCAPADLPLTDLAAANDFVSDLEVTA